MTADTQAYPPGGAAWVAAILSSENELGAPLGAGVLIAADRVLTCAHVIVGDDGKVREPLWAGFPKVSGCGPIRVASWEIRYEPPVRGHAVRDLAVLSLDEPAPAGVLPAPVRCPAGEDLRGKRWWAFGFPDGDALGDSADGEVGEALAHGWVRLNTTSQYLVRPGFSGGGLWSRDYQAVVGVVGQVHSNGDARAVTLHEANVRFPGQNFVELARWSAEAAGEVALNQWGWTLSRDLEGIRHWQPRARGVSVASDRGYRFRGRTKALTRIIDWLGREQPDRSILVVTGSPGVGKSAVLGRIVTTADRGIRGSLPAEDIAVRAEVGSVGCAVHAKGKTALEVAKEIARAASAQLPEEPTDLPHAIQAALAARDRRPFNVIIDALDEAASPAHARAIIDQVAVPLAETCADVGVRLVVGTRHRDDAGGLLGRFGAALTPLDLDAPEYFAELDMTDYALACLQLAGDERPGNPYADTNVARPLADRIASMSERNFLIAGLIARAHGLHDMQPVTPAQLELTPTVDSVLTTYLERVSPVGGLPAASVLTALAFAEAPGLPVKLWQAAVQVLFGTVLRAEDLAAFARSAAANFLVESGADGDEPATVSGPRVYRLFHQALNGALLRGRADLVPRVDDERAITSAFLGYGQAIGWENAPAYLLRALPDHAAAGGMIDGLLADDSYLLHADLRRLTAASYHPATDQGRHRATLVRLTPPAIPANPPQRAALFSLTEALERLGTDYRSGAWMAPYTARWASTPPRAEAIIFQGHRHAVSAVCPVTVDGRQLLAIGGGTVRIWDPATGEQLAVLEDQDTVNAVCVITVNGRDLLASGGSALRIWDPATREKLAVLEGHQDWILSLCPVTVNGRDLLASGSGSMIRIWDPASGEQLAVFEGHRTWVYSVCAVTVDGRDLLASGSWDATVRIWNPASGEQLAVLESHQDGVNAVCPVTVDGRNLLASGSRDATVRIWDPASGEQLAVLESHQDEVNAVCPVTVDGRNLLASGGYDATVRIWDPATGEQLAILQGHEHGVNAVCPVTVADRRLLASGGDTTVRVWDPASSDSSVTAVERDDDEVRAVCPVTFNGSQLLASGSWDATVRIWNPATGEQLAVLEGHRGWVNAVSPVTIDHRQLLASGGRDDTVRIWDPATGEQLAVLEGHQNTVWAVCPVAIDGRRQLLASGDNDGMVVLWEPATGRPVSVLLGHMGGVWSLCPVIVKGRQRLASGGIDRTIRIWDPATSEQLAVLEGHEGLVSAVCPVTVNGRDLLASGSHDGTVRIWDPATSEQLATLQGHQDTVWSVCPVTVNGRQLLASGSQDATVRIWDLITGASLITIPVRYKVFAVAEVAALLAVGLDAGILVIQPNIGM